MVTVLQRSRTRAAAALAALAAAALLAACGSAASTGAASGTPASPSAAAAFDPAASADVLLPAPTPSPGASVTLVVLVPGGGWDTHDRSGLLPLARTLETAGYAVVATEYRALRDGVGFPTTVHDVECSVAWAAAQVTKAGYVPAHVVLVGHSAGGHLAMLVGVSDGALAAPCADPLPHVDGVVGLAGVYDVRSFAYAMQDWFGSAPLDAAQEWDSGDPTYYVTSGFAPRDLRVLLLHGDDDAVVPVSQSRDFADALRAGGYDVQLQVLPGQTHLSLIEPGVSGPPILRWLRGQGW